MEAEFRCMRGLIDKEGFVSQDQEVHTELLFQTPIKARAAQDVDALSFADRRITVERRLGRT